MNHQEKLENLKIKLDALQDSLIVTACIQRRQLIQDKIRGVKWQLELLTGDKW